MAARTRSRLAPTLAVVALTTGFAFATFTGCSGGLTTQEAYDACENLQKTVGDASTFDACVACFENCADCEPSGTSPETYHCPGDEDVTTSTTGASSSSGG